MLEWSHRTMGQLDYKNSLERQIDTSHPMQLKTLLQWPLQWRLLSPPRQHLPILFKRYDSPCKCNTMEKIPTSCHTHSLSMSVCKPLPRLSPASPGGRPLLITKLFHVTKLSIKPSSYVGLQSVLKPAQLSPLLLGNLISHLGFALKNSNGRAPQVAGRYSLAVGWDEKILFSTLTGSPNESVEKTIPTEIRQSPRPKLQKLFFRQVTN